MISHIILISILALMGDLTSASPAARTSEQDVSRKVRPVIFLPALGMSVLEAEIDSSVYTGPTLCRPLLRSSYTLWLDPLRLVPGRISCLMHDLSMVYNRTTGTVMNQPGVSVTVPHFGKALALDTDFTPVEWIARQVVYLQKLVDYLSDHGYIPGKDFRAAPYDFRKGHDDELCHKLTQLIEETFYENGQEKITLMGHSLGGVIGTHFLQRQSAAWKTKFIRKWIPISAPLSGSVDSIDTLATGTVFDLSLPYAKDDLLKAIRSVPAPYYLLPTRNGWSEDEVLVQIGNKENITIRDYGRFLDLIHADDGINLMSPTEQEWHDLSHPGVDVTCIFSLGLETTSQLVYDKIQDFPSEPTRMKGDGDSTVSRSSLESCIRWSSDYSFKFDVKVLDQIVHIDMVKDKLALEAIYQSIMS